MLGSEAASMKKWTVQKGPEEVNSRNKLMGSLADCGMSLGVSMFQAHFFIGATIERKNN